MSKVVADFIHQIINLTAAAGVRLALRQPTGGLRFICTGWAEWFIPAGRWSFIGWFKDLTT